jgi:hypothetical protein
MHNLVGCLALTGGVIGIGAAGVARVGWRAPASTVYSVAQLRGHLEMQPAAWDGRTVRVRGMAEPCPWWAYSGQVRHCAGRVLVLAPPPGDAGAAPLPLVRAAAVPTFTFLGRIPLLGQLVRQSAAMPLLTTAIFHVRLVETPAAVCIGQRPCFDALLLDVAPSGDVGPAYTIAAGEPAR